MRSYWRNLIVKWINLIIFVILDFITVTAIVLLSIEYVGRDSTNALIFGFKVTAVNIHDQLWIIPAIWFLTIVVRFTILLISLRQNFKSQNITCLFDASDPYKIPMAAQVSLFSLRVPIEDIHQLILQYIRIYDIKIDKVYINISGLPNAFTVVVPIPFFQRRIVVLNSNILGLMSKREIEASFMQEVAHMNSSNSTLKTIFTSPRLFLQFMYWFVYFRIFLASLQFLEYNNIFASDFFRFSLGILFLIVTYLFFRIIELITLGFLQRSNRAAEYLADLVMLERIGKYTAINMLIKVGMRLTAINSFYEEIKWLNSRDENPLLATSLISRTTRLSKTKFIEGILDHFPLNIVNPIEARKRAPKIYVRWKLIQLRKNLLLDMSNHDILRYSKRAAKNLKQARRQLLESGDVDEIPFSFTYEKNLREKKIQISTINLGESWDRQTVEEFVNILKDHPELEFFEDKFRSGGIQNHPRIEKRIIHIWNQSENS